jgi:hypothetical protein
MLQKRLSKKDLALEKVEKIYKIFAQQIYEIQLA